MHNKCEVIFQHNVKFNLVKNYTLCYSLSLFHSPVSLVFI